MGDNYEPLDSPLLNGGALPPPPNPGFGGPPPPPSPATPIGGGIVTSSLQPEKSGIESEPRSKTETFQTTAAKTAASTAKSGKAGKKKNKESQDTVVESNPKRKRCIIISVVFMVIFLIGLGASTYLLLDGMALI